MSALRQYIDLYLEHHELIDANSAEALNALRPLACAELEGMKLPARGSENFENIDLEAILAPDYGLNIQRVPIDVNTDATFRCDVPVTSREVFLNVNDTFVDPRHAAASLPEGVTVCSLREYASAHPDEAARYYGRLADIKNPIVALDTLLVQEGMVLRVERGVRLDQPLQLVNILAGNLPLMAVRRLLVIIGEDAEAKLLVCDHTQRDDVSLCALETVEIFVADHARFDYYNLEESTESTSRLSALYLEQGEGSEVTVDGITLFNGRTRNEYWCRFRGEHSRLRLYGMGIEDRHRELSTYTMIDHRVARCKSDELFKFSADQQATAGFTGRIHVAPGSVQTEAFQANRNLVSGNEAKIYSKPQLEIYNDDVKCSHGCAIGQLDAMQLFYMRTRGLPEATAKLLLRQAFMSDVIDAVEVKSLRDRLHLLVERRFAGADSACASCAKCKTDDD